MSQRWQGKGKVPPMESWECESEKREKRSRDGKIVNGLICKYIHTNAVVQIDQLHITAGQRLLLRQRDQRVRK